MQFMVWSDYGWIISEHSPKEGQFFGKRQIVSLCPNLTYSFLNNMCRKIPLPTFVVLQKSSTFFPPHWWKFFLLDLATGLWKSSKWPFLGTCQNKWRTQVRLGFHLWFALPAWVCGAWNLSTGADEWNRRSKLMRFDNDLVLSSQGLVSQASRHLQRITNDRINHSVIAEWTEKIWFCHFFYSHYRTTPLHTHTHYFFKVKNRKFKLILYWLYPPAVPPIRKLTQAS